MPDGGGEEAKELPRAVLERLRRYDVNPSTGFLPGPGARPLARLPARFQPWELLADQINALLVARNVRSRLRQLPLLDVREQDLQSQRELDRAMLVLSLLGHAYVWGEPLARFQASDLSGGAVVIPECLARPWCQVAERLGRPPIMSHASLVLSNFALLDEKKPVELGNLRTLNTFLGGIDENWFYLCTAEIEARGAGALVAAVGAQLCVTKQDVKGVARWLKQIQGCMIRTLQSLNRMLLGNDPYIFYLRVRPFLSGWAGNPALPNGVVYEGMFNNEPQKFHGGSAAQSSLFASVDAVLGIRHETAFLEEMLRYMPCAHRNFVGSLREGPSVKLFVEQSSSEDLTQAYREAVASVQKFRTRHIQIVMLYIMAQAKKVRGSAQAMDQLPEQQRKKENEEVGTGGTSILPFLKKTRDETSAPTSE